MANKMRTTANGQGETPTERVAVLCGRLAGNNLGLGNSQTDTKVVQRKCKRKGDIVTGQRNQPLEKLHAAER